MTKKLLILVILLLASIPAYTQIVVTTAWVRRYNGPGNGSDWARSIAVDSSGNVYVAGSSYNTTTGPDYTTIKYYPNGDTAWVRKYDGPANHEDGVTCMALDHSGNVYVTGGICRTFLYDYCVDYDFATIKYYPNGVTGWVRTYDGPSNFDGDGGRALTVDSSGNVYVTGSSWCNVSLTSEYDYVTIKYDAGGNEVWIDVYNGPADRSDQATAMVIDGAGNVYVTGSSKDDYADPRITTVKYSTSGNKLWVKTDSGLVGWANDIATDTSGHIYVTGRGDGDCVTIKYDANGNKLWAARYDGPGHQTDEGEALAVDNHGNVYVAGFSYGSTTNCYYTAIKYYPNGDTGWVKAFGGPYGLATAIVVDDSGNVYVTGETGYEGDYTTVKYDSSGTQLWIKQYYGPGNDSDIPWGIALDDSGNVYVTGASVGSGTGRDFATIKYIQCPPGTAELKIYDPGCGDKLILSWPPSSSPDLQGYNIYQSWSSGGYYYKINFGLVTDTVYLDEDWVYLNDSLYYYVSAVTSMGECPYTREESGVARYPVVLVHGWHPIPNIWTEMKSYLSSDGFEHVWVPKLDGRGGHSKNADSLNKFIENKKDSVEQFVDSVYGFTGVRSTTINLMGHSMGGIISRLYVHRFRPPVDNLIMIATPNGGNLGASILAHLNPKADRATRELTISFMSQFNKDHPNVEGVHYHEVAGNYPIFHWFWCRDEYQPADPRPNDKVVNVDRVFCVPAETQRETPKGHDNHETIITNYDTYRDYILPLLDPSISAISNPDFEQSLVTNLQEQSDTLEQLLPSYVRTILPNEVIQDTVMVDSCAIGRFGIYWFNGDMKLVLYDPNGTLIDSAYTVNNPSAVYATMHTGSPYNMECYAIANPRPGNWILEVAAVAVSDTGETYYTEGVVDNNLSLSAWTDKESYLSGEKVTVRGRLYNGSFPVIGAIVNTHILKPDNSSEQLDLFDDGAHYDWEANDGVYANRFTSTDLESLYLGTIHAKGSVDEGSFSRQAFFGFWVSQVSFMRGDANGDNSINLADVIYLANYILKGGSSPIPLISGDVNCDGKYDLVDVILLARYVLLGEPFPC